MTLLRIKCWRICSPHLRLLLHMVRIKSGLQLKPAAGQLSLIWE